ncbi:hypothetical protein TI04_11290 [Achromatium sp. WMS2]|nr:hypothetical protein TI04_11290 [Achromatium sp. WMS2]
MISTKIKRLKNPVLQGGRVEPNTSKHSTSQLEFVGLTNVGLVRSNNEDCYAFLPDQNIVVVADGMGGYNAGEVASQIAVEAISSHLQSNISSEWDENTCMKHIGKAGISAPDQIPYPKTATL